MWIGGSITLNWPGNIFSMESQHITLSIDSLASLGYTRLRNRALRDSALIGEEAGREPSPSEA